MNRLWVCAALLLFALGVCVSARVGLNRVAEEEIRLLQTAQQTLQTGDAQKIGQSLEACERCWKEKSLPFYLFVNHNFFNEYEYTLFHLKDYASQDPALAAERIGYCMAVLRDQSDSQRPVLENIF